MITVLLEKIIQILEGWIQSFTSHAQHVEDKLDSIDSTASDIETNTDPIPDIRDNTAAIITPIQNIKSNTDSIATSSQTSANNTTAILNNISTLSTNTGRAAAFAEDCATNTLNIVDKVTTIASDTTQIRTTSGNIAADVSAINQAIGYYVANTLVTEDSEGDICNFDTDLEDYLQKAVVTIPADLTGFSGITLTKTGKNICNTPSPSGTVFWGTDYATLKAFLNTLPVGTYTISNKYKINELPANGKVEHGNIFITAMVNGSQISLCPHDTYVDNSPSVNKVYNDTATFTITEEIRGNINHAYLYCDQQGTHTGTGRGNYSCYEFQVEYGTAPTDFESYKSIIDTVSLGSTITDGAEIDLLSGIVKINTSPVTYSSITPIAIRTYKGVNNIYSDVGSMSLTYRETLKHYLDKQQ